MSNNNNYYNPMGNYYNSPNPNGTPFYQQPNQPQNSFSQNSFPQNSFAQTQPPQMMSQQQQIPIVQQSSINGKIVDSEDMVKVTEIPFGGYGVFPRADLTEIYFKTWNGNGTTSIIKYKPVSQQPAQTQEEIINKILQKVESLDNKLNEMSKLYPAAIIQEPVPTQTVEVPKREVTF